MVKVDRKTWKANYFTKLKGFLAEYKRILIVQADNVGSKQLQNIRIQLRGRAEVLMGKNTMMRRAILQTENEEWLQLVPLIKGNVGFIFTNEDLPDLRKEVEADKVAAPARVGAIAVEDLVIPAGPTGQDAQKTSFFQALNIPTKIARGCIDILSDVNLLKAGDRVGPSEAALLNMLGVSPFSFGLVAEHVYDEGSVYAASVLDITDDQIMKSFFAGVANVAAASMSISYPNKASVPHMLVNGYKNVLAIAVATDITFPLAEKAKAFLENPDAFIVAAPAAEEAKPAAAAAAEPEEESDDDDMDGFSLFD
jgi:large subunit ribosomal protein LP0